MKNKLGFSLMEASVVMLIAAIFIAVIASVVPRRVSPKSVAESHGRFECYYNNGSLKYQEFNNDAPATNNALTAPSSQKAKVAGAGEQRPYCIYTPNKFAKFFIMNAVGQGGSPSAGLGGSSGKFASLFFPSTHQSYWIFPGRYTGASGEDIKNGTTYVTLSGSGGNSGRVVIEAKMAATSSGEYSSLYGFDSTDIESCSITGVTSIERYNCGTSTKCTVKPDGIHVWRCVNNTIYSEEVFNVGSTQTGICKYGVGYAGCDYHRPTGSIGGNPWTEPKEGENGTFVYKDVYIVNRFVNTVPHNYVVGTAWTPRLDFNHSPSLYTMELKIKTDTTDNNGAVSKLTNMANIFSYSNNFKDAKPGNGANVGASSILGNPGAVAVTW